MLRLALALPAVLFALPLPGQAVPSQAVPSQAKPSAAIPATMPTQSVSDLPSAHPVAAVPSPSATVSWNGSALSIQGRGDTLRNILLAVSQETGMKITGGVPEEQVFGSYGPGPVQDVIPLLFDGIAVNVLLMNDGAIRPRELVLTQRTGAASPPQTRPIAEGEQGLRQRRGGFNPPPQQPVAAQPNPVPPQQQPPAATPPAPAASDPAAVAAAAAISGADATGQPQSPNGVKTPEQIFQELRARQAQASGTTQ